MSFRVTPELKMSLDQISAQNGRSLGQEVERRLAGSLEKEALLAEVLDLAFGRELAAVLMLIGRAMNRVGRRAALDATYSYDAIEGWLSVPYAFDQASRAAIGIIEAMRPPGDPAFPPEIDGVPVRGDKSILGVRGELIAADYLRSAKRPGTVRYYAGDTALEEQRDSEREAFFETVHAMLGELADRIAVPNQHEIPDRPQKSKGDQE